MAPARRRRGAVLVITAAALTVAACVDPDPPPPPPPPPTTTPGPEPTTSAEPWTYGDSPELDDLWDACASHDARACDELYLRSPRSSDYESFGKTCGGRTEGGDWCSSDDSAPTSTAPAEPPWLITDLVGEPVGGDMLAAVLDVYDCQVEGVFVDHYKCLADGIELAVDNATNVSSVFLYAEGVADFGEFTGEMPGGLHWGESWSDIESAWGPPAQQFDQVIDDRFTVVYDAASNYSTVTLDFTADPRRLVQATFTE
ncbi:hypothetical protein [Georgenia satyanarayanai]|uniref:hypothetical protein n=1 Tax=Georgenia satyanarayanai TaxID=860221 RepID=UPI001264D968|nr:hypothetical protein [Georgenia satyanarayanai]